MEEEAEKTQEPKEVVECWKPSSSHGMVLALSFLADGTTDLREVNRRIELRSWGGGGQEQPVSALICWDTPSRPLATLSLFNLTNT